MREGGSTRGREYIREYRRGYRAAAAGVHESTRQGGGGGGGTHLVKSLLWRATWYAAYMSASLRSALPRLETFL
jgi:hypothetical protein